MVRFLIVTGGSIDYVWAKQWLEKRSYDYVIAADSGLEHACALDIPVDFILGDYDSINPGVLERFTHSTQTVTYPRRKDFTDTHLALLTAINKGAENIDIIGATGSRLDHTMTNVFVMKAALDAGVFCAMYDAHNKIYLLDGTVHIEKCRQYGAYVSLAPMSSEVTVSLSGVLYPLEHFVLKQGLSLCQSNEISEEDAVIAVEDGIAVVYETKD